MVADVGEPTDPESIARMHDDVAAFLDEERKRAGANLNEDMPEELVEMGWRYAVTPEERDPDAALGPEDHAVAVTETGQLVLNLSEVTPTTDRPEPAPAKTGTSKSQPRTGDKPMKVRSSIKKRKDPKSLMQQDRRVDLEHPLGWD